MRKKAIILGTCIILFVAALSTRMGHFQAGTETDVSDNPADAYEYYYNTDSPGDEGLKDSNKKSKEEKQYIEVDTRPDSYTVLVNRDYPISKDYVPDDLVVPNVRFSFYGTYEKSYVRKRAANALETLFAAATQEGYTLKAVSAYRSYERQMQIYNNNVKTRGEEKTNKVSAMPGSSEHQTGLAIDVSSDSVGCGLIEAFGRSAEGKWLKKNCHKYGFIIRYPKRKTKITGYSYEPWHIRYVGKNLAKYLKKKKLTLEEYYKLTTIENKVAEDPIVDTDADTGIPDEPQMTAAPKPKATIVPTAPPVYAPPVNVPTPSKAPAATEEPEVTEKPKATKKPKVTPAPENTPDVSVTKEPAATKKPDATKAPVVTEKPAETAAPAVTEPPASDGEGSSEGNTE